MNQKTDGEDLTQAVSSVIFTLNHILPNVNKLLEDNILLIGQSFSKIAQDTKDIQSLVDDFDKDAISSEDSDKINSLEFKLSEISQSVNQAIVGMQFQDRVSQNLVIAQDISKVLFESITKELELDELGKATSHQKAILKNILEKIKLGEIKKEFVDFLIRHKFVESGEEIGYFENKSTSSMDLEDEIELF